jgi:hypothetical protein
MILDYLWQYPPYIILLIMIDLVSVPYPPGVFYPPVYMVVGYVEILGQKLLYVIIT